MTHTKTLACATALMMILGSAAYAQTTSPSTTSPSTGSSGLSPTAEECKTAAKMNLPECQKYRNQAQMPGSSSSGTAGATGTTGSGTSSSGSSTSSGSMGTTGSSGTTK